MVFPVESEDRTLRNLLMMCQDHARLVVETFRKVLAMIDSLVRDDPDGMKEKLDEVKMLHQESIDVKRSILTELHKIGSMLFNREDLYRLISKASELNDSIESMGVRIMMMSDREWKIPPEIGKSLIELSDASFDTIIKLRESLLSLGFNSERSLQLARDVHESERKVDTLFRQTDLNIITSKIDLPIILVLRDVISKLEDMVDKAAEEADLIRILAL